MKKQKLLLMTMVRLCVGSTLQHQFDIFTSIYLKLLIPESNKNEMLVHIAAVKILEM